MDQNTNKVTETPGGTGLAMNPNSDNEMKTSFGTKLAWCAGDMGFSFSWGVVSGFLTLYYTDSAGLSAAFAGTMMLVCRLLDGFSDLLAGIIIEKTTSRLGKCRFWFIVSIVPLAISMILLFNVPSNADMLSKQIYATVTYIFMAVVCYTMANIAYNSLLSRFTVTPDDVVSAATMRTVLAIGSSMIANMVIMNVLNAFGGVKEAGAWRTMAIIFTCIGVVFQLVTAIFVKERQVEQEEVVVTDSKTKEKKKLGPIFKAVLKDRNFWIICFEFLFINANFLGINAYYARDVLGNENLVGTMSMAWMIPVVLLQPILPKLVRSFGKRNILLVSAVLITLQGVITMISPFNSSVVLAAIVIGGCGRGGFMGLIFTLSADLVDHFKAKEGDGAEGICYSTTSIGTKVGSGIGLAFVGWTLQFGNYNAALTEQAPGTLQAMINLLGIGTVVLGALMFLGICFLNLKNPNQKTEIE